MGKKRVFAALLALAVLFAGVIRNIFQESFPLFRYSLYRYDGPLGGDRHHEME